jgi:hypothetical protein
MWGDRVDPLLPANKSTYPLLPPLDNSWDTVCSTVLIELCDTIIQRGDVRN